MKTISILLPVINCEKYINESINSLLSQTYQDFELIIVADPSIDNTLKIIESIKDSRIKIIENNKKLGLAKSLNRGIQESSGTFIARADADDISFPNRLAVQLEYIKKMDVDLVGSKYINEYIQNGEIKQNNSRLCEPSTTRAHMFFYWITHGTLMFKRKMITDLKSVYIDRPAEDYNLFVRLAKKYKFYDIPEVLVKVRVRNDSLCGKSWNLIKNDIDKMRLEQLSDLNIIPTTEEQKLHLALVDRDYMLLAKSSLYKIYDWINKVVKANNDMNIFPITYFNNEWKFRLTRLIKKKDNRSIRDILIYNTLSNELGYSIDLRSLIYLYRYNNN